MVEKEIEKKGGVGLGKRTREAGYAGQANESVRSRTISRRETTGRVYGALYP